MHVRFALPVLLCCGLTHAAQVTVYKDQNFKGPELALEQEAHDLGPMNFHDQISSMVVRGGAWEVCTQPGFQGDCVVLQPGAYATLPSSINHRIESLRAASARASGSPDADAAKPAALVLFSAPRFMGRSHELTRDAQATLETPFRAPPASLVVREGTWQLCTEPGFRGTCRIFPRGRYLDLQPETMPVMSLRRVSD
jgi:beta/gamma crystallin